MDDHKVQNAEQLNRAEEAPAAASSVINPPFPGTLTTSFLAPEGCLCSARPSITNSHFPHPLLHWTPTVGRHKLINSAPWLLFYGVINDQTMGIHSPKNRRSEVEKKRHCLYHRLAQLISYCPKAPVPQLSSALDLISGSQTSHSSLFSLFTLFSLSPRTPSMWHMMSVPPDLVTHSSTITF